MIFNASELMCDIVPGTQASSFYGKSSNPEKGSILQIDGILYKHKPGAIGGSKLMLGPAGASSSNGQSKASISDGSNDDGKATEDKWNVVRNDAIKIESNELEDNRKDAGKEGSSANLGFFSGKDISITIFRGYEADLKNGHDAYEIEMKVVEETCKVPRNYQDLENLEKILVSSGKLIVPRLPDKKQGFLKIDTINLETLKWLVFLKKCIQDPVLRENQDLYNFLTKDSKFSEESISSRLEPSGMLNLLINWVLESFKQPNSKDFPADLMDSEQKFQKLYLKIQRLYEGIIKLLALNEDPDAEKMQDLMKAIQNDWSAKEIEDFELSSIEEIIREARKNLSEGEDVPLLMRLESILSDAYAVCCSFALLKEKLSKLEKENGQKLIEEFKKEAGVYENRINQELVELF